MKSGLRIYISSHKPGRRENQGRSVKIRFRNRATSMCLEAGSGTYCRLRRAIVVAAQLERGGSITAPLAPHTFSFLWHSAHLSGAAFFAAASLL